MKLLNKEKQALIIFVKNPVKGKVKTRLAKTIGEENAVEIYQLLLNHTRKISLETDCDKFVFHKDNISNNDLWDTKEFNKQLQHGSDLGERMKNAFNFVFNQGYQKVTIIGSDCYEIQSEDINKAFELMNKASVVIGPAYDGGYYLLGLNKKIPDIFTNVEWSTKKVFPETVHRLNQSKTSYALLPALSDIDVEDDLPEELMIKIGMI